MRARLHFVLTIASALALCACAPRFSGLRHYQRDLDLHVRLPADSCVEGHSLPAILSIRNVGGLLLEFCIESDARDYAITAIDKPRSRGQIMSHPGCTRRVTLEPGHDTEWSASFDLLDAPPGPAQLTTAIAIVDPLTCEGVRGCQSIMLRSSPVTFQIVPTEERPSQE